MVFAGRIPLESVSAGPNVRCARTMRRSIDRDAMCVRELYAFFVWGSGGDGSRVSTRGPNEKYETGAEKDVGKRKGRIEYSVTFFPLAEAGRLVSRIGSISFLDNARTGSFINQKR